MRAVFSLIAATAPSSLLFSGSKKKKGKKKTNNRPRRPSCSSLSVSRRWGARASCRLPPCLFVRVRVASTLFPRDRGACAMSLNLPLVIREYVLKMLNEASVGMKALILDDYTVRMGR